MADRVNEEFLPPWFLENNDGWSTIKVLNRLENDEDNRYSWKLTRNLDSLSLTVSCKPHAKSPNKAKDDSEVAEHATVKPVRRRRKKRDSF